MKKIISVFLVLTVLVNVIGFGFMSVKASAEVVTALAITVLGIVAGAIIGGLGSLAADAITDNSYKFYAAHEDLINKINNNGIQNGEVMQVSEQRLNDGSYRYYLEPVSGLSSDDAAFVQSLCDKINNGNGLNAFVTSYLAYNDGALDDKPFDTISRGAKASARSYEKFKTDVTNALLESYAEKAAQEQLEGYEALSETSDFIKYDFSFTGPVQGFRMPTLSGFASYNNTDFFLHTPVLFDKSDPYCSFSSYEQAKAFGLEDIGQESSGRWVGSAKINNNYGAGVYVIYNGTIYYFGTFSFSEKRNQYVRFDYSTPSINDFVSSSGQKLTDAGCTSLAGLYYGYYDMLSANKERPFTEISPDDLTQTIGGTDLVVPLTDEEATVAAAAQAGLLPDDFSITLDDIGNILAANGISLATLEDLMGKLVDGQVKFEDFESYLQYITTLLSTANVDRQTISKIISSINSYAKSTAKDISKVNSAIAGVKELEEAQTASLTNIEEYTKAISEALTAVRQNNLDFDIPNITIIDKFPFSLPWDFYNILTILCTEPKEPVFVVPIKTTIKNGGLNYEVNEEITLDLTIFRVNGVDIVRAITNSSTILLAVICLISMTRKFIWK